MEKMKIKNNLVVYPMPVVLVGAEVEGRPNFMTAAWISVVNISPPMIAMALGKRHTGKGIREHREFSVNVPGVELMEATDYCGLVSGKTHDKSGVFETIDGELKHAPMIARCPVTVECKLVQTVDLPSHTLFVGEMVGVYSEEQYLTDGNLDFQKVKPFVLTMPDNNYWALGDSVGKAWSSGKSLKVKKE
jgi:flavin reductase (DIM6/NTAB) family NADH-FMN oxidoreductase RutF